MGTGIGRTGEEEHHLLSDNPPPPAHTKATCPWRENTMPLLPPSFPRPLRHPTRARRPCASIPETRVAPGHWWYPPVHPTCHPNRSLCFPPAGLAEGAHAGGWEGESGGQMPPWRFSKGGKPLMEKTKTNAQSCLREALCL